jgi:oligosaccharyltransferase complex subunit gamma
MIIVIPFIGVMSSGYMWNTIRNPPFIAMGMTGGAEFINSQFQSQNGVETFIVAFLCILYLTRFNSFFGFDWG